MLENPLYLIPALGVVALLWFLLSKRNPAPETDISASDSKSLVWDPTDVSKSLTAVFDYVANEAERSTNWYWTNKRWKARLSRMVQLAAIMLTAAGGLVPVAGIIFGKALTESPAFNLWPSFLVGLAAALLGIDRAFGFSTGWARYVITATSIRKALEEFRMDWTALVAHLPKDPTVEQLTPLIQRAKEFRLSVESMVLQETQEWATEFQNNIAQMEKDIKAQLEALKAQVQKQKQDEAAATKPGGIQINVSNATKADGGRFEVIVLSKSATVATDSDPAARSTASVLDLPPGQYKLVIKAIVNSKPVSASTLAAVKPNETTLCELQLPE
ncbi:MAG: SLATT domain-containing protein [Bryobacterales bacterium]|nr:SLATT domain-containing protein [Bryobacterales bacterium]